MAINTQNKTFEHFKNRPYSPDNAGYLISILVYDISRLNSIINQLPKTGRNGFSDSPPQYNLDFEKNELIRKLEDYRGILIEYHQAADRSMTEIRNNSERIKNDQKLLKSRKVQDLYIDSLDGLYGQYNKHRDTKIRINNMLDCLQKTINKTAAPKLSKRKPYNPLFLKSTGNTAFEIEAKPIFNSITNKRLKPIKQAKKELIHSYTILPNVDRNSYSECPFAEDLYAEKQKHQHYIELYLKEYRKHKKELIEKINKAKNTAIVLDNDKISIPSENSYEKYEQAQVKQLQRLKTLQNSLADLQLQINDLEILLGITNQKQWPEGDALLGSSFKNYNSTMVNKPSVKQDVIPGVLSSEIKKADSAFKKESMINPINNTNSIVRKA
ncbi:MAG: hypothetical protein JXA96_13170 [Sedimentisphaerales bacterium]|nr:hypothetical protein [Sedimentisphaerales bacterium]